MLDIADAIRSRIPAGDSPFYVAYAGAWLAFLSAAAAVAWHDRGALSRQARATPASS